MFGMHTSLHHYWKTASSAARASLCPIQVHNLTSSQLRWKPETGASDSMATRILASITVQNVRASIHSVIVMVSFWSTCSVLLDLLLHVKRSAKFPLLLLTVSPLGTRAVLSITVISRSQIIINISVPIMPAWTKNVLLSDATF